MAAGELWRSAKRSRAARTLGRSKVVRGPTTASVRPSTRSRTARPGAERTVSDPLRADFARSPRAPAWTSTSRHRYRCRHRSWGPRPQPGVEESS
ncbi:hypothetical protein NKG05_19720 [Oerskovia sp. M15]